MAQHNRLEHLRIWLAENQLDGLLINRCDRFLNNYTAPYPNPLEWITGFPGSDGIAIITHDHAALFVDSRYTLSAAQAIDATKITSLPRNPSRIFQWLNENFSEEGRLGYDPWKHTIREIEDYAAFNSHKHIKLTPLTTDPFDVIWDNPPPCPQEKLFHHDVGATSQEKCTQVSKDLTTEYALICDLPSIAWLLNLRATGLSWIPVPLSYALLSKSGHVTLFLKENVEHIPYLTNLPHVECDTIKALPIIFQKKCHSQKVAIDPNKTSVALVKILEDAGAVLVQEKNPCLIHKAVKHPQEIEGIRKGHIVDGLALTRFLYWVHHIPLNGQETEFSAAQKLRSLRLGGEDFFLDSFDAISSFGPNSAMIHYQPTADSHGILQGSGLYLVDSGGNYRSGATTDVTRTVALGNAAFEEEKEIYTSVLKGHIALATTIFPQGTRGIHLDGFARRYLWEKGLNYAHGTGHGVGSFLSIHEGPQSINTQDDGTALEPGMVLSNEPGYYKEGAFGIRIENLILVVEKHMGSSTFLGFETVTCAPLDPKLILTEKLSKEERQWVNDYHHWVFQSLSPSLEESERAWLKKQTQPL